MKHLVFSLLFAACLSLGAFAGTNKDGARKPSSEESDFGCYRWKGHDARIRFVEMRLWLDRSGEGESKMIFVEASGNKVQNEVVCTKDLLGPCAVADKMGAFSIVEDTGTSIQVDFQGNPVVFASKNGQRRAGVKGERTMRLEFNRINKNLCHM